MYFPTTVVLTVLMALGVSPAAVKDLSCLPQPGEKYVHAGECCKMEFSVPQTMKDSTKHCMKTNPLPPPHEVVNPLPELTAKLACMGECVFQNLSLLTEDKALDKEAVKKYFSEISSEDSVDALVDKCMDMSAADVDSAQECKSGAEEFHMCLNRQFFLDCPEDKFSDSDECKAYKDKVMKCPMVPVFMGPHPHHHHHHDHHAKP